MLGLAERSWRSESEGEEVFARGKKTGATRLDIDRDYRQGVGYPANGYRGKRAAHARGTTRLRSAVLRSLVVSRCIVMMTTRASVLAGHCEAKHQRQHDPEESHRPHYTAFSFQRPCRNRIALATASVENAMVTAQATPWGPKLKCRANTHAIGISHNQKQNRLSHVGVQVSPAPLKEFVRTMA